MLNQEHDHEVAPEDCDHLHYRGGFTLEIFDLNSGAKKFNNWFEDVLKIQHPHIYQAFGFVVGEDEDGPVLEISNYDSDFPLKSLVALYASYGFDSKSQKN